MQKPIDILLVEDNHIDVKLTMEALKEGKVRNTLFVARDGEEALDFLLRARIHNVPFEHDVLARSGGS